MKLLAKSGFFFLYKKYTVTCPALTCHYQSMARSGNCKAVQKASEVTFSVELRQATFEQLEAGKRLFKRLVSRARAKDGVNCER
jgi:hypothetical protein